MPIATRLRETRRRLGLTQAELARCAGVSLATVQNTEAGRANPALATLERLLEPLGLSIELAPAPADWGALTALGLPLAGTPAPYLTRDAVALRRHVALAAEELERAPGAPGVERKRECLHALVLAALTHFPGATRRWTRAGAPVRRLLASPATGRVVKLARIARAHLAEYL